MLRRTALSIFPVGIATWLKGQPAPSSTFSAATFQNRLMTNGIPYHEFLDLFKNADPRVRKIAISVIPDLDRDPRLNRRDLLHRLFMEVMPINRQNQDVIRAGIAGLEKLYQPLVNDPRYPYKQESIFLKHGCKLQKKKHLVLQHGVKNMERLK